jgi:N utilization substance protein B
MSRTPRASRHRSREAALQVLYSLDLAQPDGADLARAGAEAFESTSEHFELPEGARAFAKELIAGVTAHRAALDDLLSAHARNWRLARMATVDRNVLRLAAFELLYSTTPAPVVIDEAVELARRFGGDKSPAFVNGILDAVAHAVRPEGA